ncbi:DUF711 family protein [Clostridiaceae bacterium]|nr:DUF711 family protein [Clostridiaceae bacterium]RKI12922.1 DUF711 family protein [bacterium 1XD21-70]
MVGIRSVTYQLSENYDKNELDIILDISREWAKRYSLIRTQRISLAPIYTPCDMSRFSAISQVCDLSDIRWFNIPVDPWKAEKKADRDLMFKFSEMVLANYGRAFINILTFKENQADQDIMERSAYLVKKVGQLSENGRDNFRLGLSVNIPNDGPFFPFTKSSGEFGFSIALELTQDINKICDSNPKNSLWQLREKIRDDLKRQISNINQIALDIEKKYGIVFHGFDFSIAPIIAKDGSIVTILQRLGIYNFGKTGTMFATGYLTDLIKSFQKDFKSVGFSGVMYSMLEDLDLCMINNQRGISLEELIKVSTMCGCGVDMVPVSGDISIQEIITILLEVYMISVRLNKPLGIRLLPITSCHRDQIYYTNLYDDADFIANTKVVSIDLNIIKNIGEKFELYCHKC